MRFFMILLYCFLVSGCLSTDISHVDEISLARKESKYVVKKDFPQWYYLLRSQDSMDESAACSAVKGSGFKFENDARVIAKQYARVDLIKKTSRKQKLFAKEEVMHNGDVQMYTASIKSKSYGTLGRNGVSKENFYSIGGVKYLCVAIKLL